ncbi:MAG: Lrp/AsnC family transcriptional regulator [Xanthomonadales bacterium]|jgi:DNA-binding Lrp family transcriptional regulator|nr:Lrp/AsnC family transcriptional regulator [Xanthomonadales bacterium]
MSKNPEKPEKVRKRAVDAAGLDRMDRKILGVLVDDAGRGYADIGREVGLSAPAVHERVKKLRARGVITGSAVRLDGPSIGRPLLVFVHVATHSWGHSEALDALSVLPELEEVHSTTGATSIIMKIRLADSQALEALLRHINAFESVVSTHTYVTLSTYLERPVQAGVTEDWPDAPRPRS